MEPSPATVARILTEGLFYRLLVHPEDRGSAFTWEKFTGLAVQRVKDELFLYFERDTTLEDQDIAELAARTTAEGLLHQHHFLP